MTDVALPLPVPAHSLAIRCGDPVKIRSFSLHNEAGALHSSEIIPDLKDRSMTGIH